MKKILILRNNVVDTATLDKGIALAKQWALAIALDLQFDVKDTSAQFSSYAYSNAAVGTTAAVYPDEILAKTPPGYDVSCLIYDWLKVTGPQPKNPSDAMEIVNGCTPMQIPVQWYVTYPEVFAQFFLHELCHEESFRNGKFDMTHLLTDGNLQAADPVLYSQFSRLQSQDWYLYLLKSLIPASTLPSPYANGWAPDDPRNKYNTETGKLNPNYKSHMQEAIITRRITGETKETRGDLAFGTFACKTLERPWLDNKPNISCIPTGTYTCIWAYMHDMKEWHYQVQNVPGRTGIFIHELNYVSQTNGCIGLGNSYQDINGDGNLDVLNSRATLKQFESLGAKQSILLTIK